MDIISMAQQARPNDIGQIELRRAQFTTLSSDANKIPSSFRKFASCPGASSVTPLPNSTAMAYVAPCCTLQRTAFILPKCNRLCNATNQPRYDLLGFFIRRGLLRFLGALPIFVGVVGLQGLGLLHGLLAEIPRSE